MASANGRLLSHLPAIYHASEDLRELLAVFEATLFGPDGQDEHKKQPRRSLDEILPVGDSIATISSLFDAYETPGDFLPWLAQWVALSFLEGLTVEQQRDLLAGIVPLYAQRGTKIYLKKLLKFFNPQKAKISIDDQGLAGFVIGTASVGIDTQLERDRPFWFRVKIDMSALAIDSDRQSEFIAQREKRIRRVIDLAKPAHTLYELDWQFEANQT